MAVVHRLTAERTHTTWSAQHPPVLTVDSGDEVAFECRDGFDGQLHGRPTGPLGDDLAGLDFGRIAPLSGPVVMRSNHGPAGSSSDASGSNPRGTAVP